MVDIPLRGKVRDPQRHAFAVRASKWFVAGLIGCSFVIGLAGTRDPIEVLAVTGFLSVTLCVLPILFAWYMLGEYSHPLTTVYILRASADDLVLHDAGGAAVGSLRAGQIQVSRTNAEVWRNAGTKYAQSNLSAVVQVRSPGGTFFIFPDATVAPERRLRDDPDDDLLRAPPGRVLPGRAPRGGPAARVSPAGWRARRARAPGEGLRGRCTRARARSRCSCSAGCRRSHRPSSGPSSRSSRRR
jgi:hypothetical protein